MAYTAHRRIARDDCESFVRRASSARSCALHVAEKLGVPRSIIIRIVAERTGTDLMRPESAEAILAAIEYLELLRMGREPIPVEVAERRGA
jgi:hypothetical protein